MKRTNTKEYNKAIYKYILECIDSEDINLQTDKDKIKHFFDKFNSEYNNKNNQLRYPNLQIRIANYLQGIPFNFATWGNEIIEVAEKLHECKLTDKQQEKVIANYYNHIALKIIELRKNLIK
tara:strand:- start:164 stop:529 length:366 start_codon:yes stop_codon:yes gene_type:complete